VNKGVSQEVSGLLKQLDKFHPPLKVKSVNMKDKQPTFAGGKWFGWDCAVMLFISHNNYMK
jgi:hypothetical protein